jgi:hypothetical protein
MPIKGPLRAVDTKVLGVSLEHTPLHGSALERHVFVSVDAGHGHAEGTLDFIAREGGIVVRAAATDPSTADPAHWSALAAARRSLDVVLISAGTLAADAAPADSAARAGETLQAASAAIAALRAAGGRVFVTFDVQADR